MNRSVITRLPSSASIRVTELPSPARPEALPEAMAGEANPAVLASTAVHPQFGRFSIFACRPLRVLELRHARLIDEQGRVLAEGNDAIWNALDTALSPRIRQAPAECPYLPGWIGYVGYEIGRTIERLPSRAPRDTALPDLRLAFYDALLVFDALTARWRLVECRFDSPPPGAGDAAAALREHLADAPDATEATICNVSSPDRAISNFQPEEYRRAVARCAEYIAAGDIFQVNLSQRFTVHDAPDALAIYQALRRRNPAWYSAYLRFSSNGHDCAVAGSSPELFLRCRGREVLTRPIKGTRPRLGEAEQDAAAAADLLRSEKDNAELAMIIDLLRNDLGRVCRFGSVRVVEPRRLETHPTVFHLVGTVAGRLRSDVGPAGLLRATFPGGSITGAPKIRAMEIIDELEPVARGVYTGIIGIVGVDGSAEWSIAIRTVVCDGGRALVQAGGGIVADSTPEGEYRETLDKARALREAIASAVSCEAKTGYDVPRL